MAKKKSPDLHAEIQSMISKYGTAQTIKTLTRRANRRLERASEGQRKALEYYVGQEKFSAATKGLNTQQVQMKLESLEKFLGGKSTTKTGWKEIKTANVAKANETLRKEGYTLTDEELANILIQVDTSNTQAKYRAINLVQAAKNKAELEGDIWSGSEEQISDAIAEKMEASEALEAALQSRKAIQAKRKAEAKKQKQLQERHNKVALSVGKNPRKKR